MVFFGQAPGAPPRHAPPTPGSSRYPHPILNQSANQNRFQPPTVNQSASRFPAPGRKTNVNPPPKDQGNTGKPHLISKIEHEERIVLKKHRSLLLIFIIVALIAAAGLAYCVKYYRDYGMPATIYSKESFEDIIIALVTVVLVVPLGFFLLKMGVTNILVGFIYMFLLVLCIYYPSKGIKSAYLSLIEDKPTNIHYSVENPDERNTLHPYWENIQRKHECCGTQEIDRVNDWPYILDGTNIPPSCCTQRHLLNLTTYHKKPGPDGKDDPEFKRNVEKSCGLGLGRMRTKGENFRPFNIQQRVFSGFYLSLTDVELQAMKDKFNAVINPERFFVNKMSAVTEHIEQMPANKAFAQIWKSYYMDHICNFGDFKREKLAKLADRIKEPRNGTEDHGFIPCDDKHKKQIEEENDLSYPGNFDIKFETQSLGWIKGKFGLIVSCYLDGSGDLIDLERNITVYLNETKTPPTTTTTTTTTTPSTTTASTTTTTAKPLDDGKPIRFWNGIVVQGYANEPGATYCNWKKIYEEKIKTDEEDPTRLQEFNKAKEENEQWKWVERKENEKQRKEYLDIREEHSLDESITDKWIDDCIYPKRLYELAKVQGKVKDPNEAEPKLDPVKCGNQRRKREAFARDAPEPDKLKEPGEENLGGIYPKGDEDGEKYCRRIYPDSRRSATTLGRELLLVLDYLTTYIYEIQPKVGEKIETPLKYQPVFWPVPTQFHKKDMHPYKLAANLGRVPNPRDEAQAKKFAKKMYYMSRGITENLILDSFIHDKPCELVDTKSINITILWQKLAHDVNRRFRLWGPHTAWRNHLEGLGQWLHSFIYQLAWICIGISSGIIVMVIIIAIVFWGYYSRVKKEDYANLALPEEFKETLHLKRISDEEIDIRRSRLSHFIPHYHMPHNMPHNRRSRQGRGRETMHQNYPPPSNYLLADQGYEMDRYSHHSHQPYGPSPYGPYPPQQQQFPYSPSANFPSRQSYGQYPPYSQQDRRRTHRHQREYEPLEQFLPSNYNFNRYR